MRYPSSEASGIPRSEFAAPGRLTPIWQVMSGILVIRFIHKSSDNLTSIDFFNFSISFLIAASLHRIGFANLSFSCLTNSTSFLLSYFDCSPSSSTSDSSRSEKSECAKSTSSSGIIETAIWMKTDARRVGNRYHIQLLCVTGNWHQTCQVWRFDILWDSNLPYPIT